MKQWIWIPLILALVTACSKIDPDVMENAYQPMYTAKMVAAPENGVANFKHNFNLEPGEVLERTGVEQKGYYIVNSSGDKSARPLDYVQVKTKDSQVTWINKRLYVPGGKLAVIKNDGIMAMNSPMDNDLSTVALPKYNLVTLYPSEDKNPEFYKIQGENYQTNGYVIDKFLFTKDISTDEKDVAAAVLLHRATNSKLPDPSQVEAFEAALSFKKGILDEAKNIGSTLLSSRIESEIAALP